MFGFMQCWGLNPEHHGCQANTATSKFHPQPESLNAMAPLHSCSEDAPSVPTTETGALLTVASCVLGLAGRAQHTAKG